MSNPSIRGELQVLGPEAADHFVSAEVLARIMSGAQESVLVIASALNQRKLGERFKPTEALKSSHILRFGPFKPNCLVLPWELGFNDDGGQASLGFDQHSVAQKLHQSLKFLQEKQAFNIETLLPGQWGRRLMRGLTTMLPRAGERWSLGATFETERVEVGGPAASELTRAITRPRDEQQQMTFTGYLVGVHFDKRELVIKHPSSNKTITCDYVDDIEENMLQARRGPVQVTGTFILDADGEPKSLSDVTWIEPVDLSPMQVDIATYDGTSVILDPPLYLEPALSEESKQLFIAEDHKLGLSSFASTRSELLEEIHRELVFMWRAYVEEDISALAPDAIELRQTLMSRMRLA